MLQNMKKSIGSWYLAKTVKLPRDVTKFVLITSARTGSNLLCGMLASHPEIRCFYELFHPKAIYAGPNGNELPLTKSTKERDRRPGAFLESAYSNNNQEQAVGFKIFPRHNDIVLDYLIRNHDIRKIVLRRHTLLHQFTSELIAKINRPLQQPGSDGSENVARAVTVFVEKDEFCRFVDHMNKFYDFVEKQLADQHYISLEYSEMVRHEQAILRDLLVFLGVDTQVELSKFHKKENPRGLKSRIVNYDSLSQELNGTPYGEFFRNEF